MAAFCAVTFSLAPAGAESEAPTLPAPVTAFLKHEKIEKKKDPTLLSIHETVIPALKALVQSEVLVNTLRQDNNARLALTSMEIEKLRNQWSRAFALRDYDRLDPILKSPASMTLQQLKSETGIHGIRLYLTNNRSMLTAAAQTPIESGQQGPDAWRQIYLSPRETVFIQKEDSGYRVEIGIWDQREAVGTLIAEIPEPQSEAAPISSASAESGDHLNLR
jgi:hypothetical protein